MLGGIGQAMMFMFALAGLAIATPYVFLHLSHVYVTALTMSSGGEDHFRWPKTGFYEWFGEALAVVAGLFVSGAISLMLAGPVFVFAPGATVAVVWLVCAWLIAPICLCTILSGAAQGAPFDPILVGRFLRQGKGLLFVYALTTPLGLLTASGLWLAFVRVNIVGVLIAAVFLPPTVLLHARAWGRLVWLAYNFDRKPRRKKRRKRPDESIDPAPDVAASLSTDEGSSEPLVVELEVEEEALEVDLEVDEADPEDYDIAEVRGPTGDRLVTMTDYYDQQHEEERKLRERLGDPHPDRLVAPVAPTFETALRQKVVSFVFYPETMGAAVTLGLSATIELLLAHMVVAFVF